MSNPNISEEIVGAEADQMSELATQYIRANILGKEWPYDDWIALGKNGEFDLNLWSDELKDGTQQKSAAVYKTVQGEKYKSTDTSRWVTIDVTKLLQEKTKERD